MKKIISNKTDYCRRTRVYFYIRRYQVIIFFLFFLVFGNVEIFSWAKKIVLPNYPYCAAITFDDGPHPDYTEKILKILDNGQAKATFFVVGKMVERYPELAQEIVMEGHQIANHTYDHIRLINLSQTQIVDQLERTRRILNQVCKVNTYYFRPPGGHYDQKVIEAFSLFQYQMVLWTVFPHDQADIDSAELVERIIGKVRDRDIILLHSGVEVTLQALPSVIAQLKKKGFELVTISELKTREKDAKRTYADLRS
ncbi:MAG: polysaccharide deacetylase family protein [Elusimicrobiota bacterium]